MYKGVAMSNNSIPPFNHLQIQRMDPGSRFKVNGVKKCFYRNPDGSKFCAEGDDISITVDSRKNLNQSGEGVMYLGFSGEPCDSEAAYLDPKKTIKKSVSTKMNEYVKFHDGSYGHVRHWRPSLILPKDPKKTIEPPPDYEIPSRRSTFLQKSTSLQNASQFGLSRHHYDQVEDFSIRSMRSNYRK